MPVIYSSYNNEVAQNSLETLLPRTWRASQGQSPPAGGWLKKGLRDRNPRGLSFWKLASSIPGVRQMPHHLGACLGQPEQGAAVLAKTWWPRLLSRWELLKDITVTRNTVGRMSRKRTGVGYITKWTARCTPPLYTICAERRPPAGCKRPCRYTTRSIGR